MYSAEIVERRLELAKEELGYWLEYHSPEEIDEFNRQLEAKYADEYYSAGNAAQGTEDPTKSFQIHIQRMLCGQVSRLSREEVRFIQNERHLIQCDSAYFLTRYFYIKTPHAIQRFSFLPGQKAYFDVMAELEARVAPIEMVICKARQHGCCLDPDTRVLTADFEWKRIEDIRIGEDIVSIDEDYPSVKANGYWNARKMRPAVVENRIEVFEHCIRIGLANGKHLMATPTHRFLCKKKGYVEAVWRKSNQIAIGDSVRTICDTWEEPTYEDGWFGGILDGEGTIRPKERAGCELSVSQVFGPVYDRIRRYLQNNGITFREEVDNRKAGETSKFGNKPVGRMVVGRMGDLFKLVGKTKPSRWGRHEWWHGKELPGRDGSGWSEIVSLELLPPRRMVDLQTSTKTFIAEGFVSHNSTMTEGLILHRGVTSYGVNAVAASAQQQSTGKMSQMIFLGYDRLPWWIRPLSTRRVESDKGMLVFGGSESGISFQHGNQRYGIARGDTVGVYHLSEVSSYPNASELIEDSLFKCVHPHPGVFGVLESTAAGDSGWWYDTYWHSKKQWKNNRSRLCPLFLPWFVGTDKYPTETWTRTHPIPREWNPAKETRKMVAKAQLYVQSAPILGKVLGANWKMPREQAYYWEVNFQEALAKGKQKTYLQEMPTDDTEAFQGSYDSVFGHEVIADIWTKRKGSYAVYGIVGQSIEERHEPLDYEIDTTERIIPVQYRSRKGPSYSWELWPLKWMEDGIFTEITDIRDDESHMGKLFVWYEPEPGYDYSVGVDTSGGLGQDATCIAVSRRGRTPQERDMQVAEFRSNKVSHVEAYAWVMAICAYFGRYMADTTSYSEPYVAIEQLASVGDTCQLQMSKMGYNRFHKMIRYDSAPKKMRKDKAGRRGWYTSGWSRPMLTDSFVILVQNGWYVVNSPYTMREMQQWEVHFTGKGIEKLEHAENSTDDGVFANAMAAFCPNDLRTQAERSSKQFGSLDSKLPRLDISTSSGIRINPDGHGVVTEDELRSMMRR